MKIKSLAVSPTAFLHLKGPDGAYLYEGEGKDKKKVGIDLYGPGSPEFATIDGQVTARMTKNMQENDGKYTPPSVEERRTQEAQDLTAATAGFHHIEYDGADNKPLTGRDLFLAVYSDPTLGWIKAQAAKFVGDWGRFTAGSATS